MVKYPKIGSCDIDFWPRTLNFNSGFAVVVRNFIKLFMSYRVDREQTKKLSDDAENNNVVSTADSNNRDCLFISLIDDVLILYAVYNCSSMANGDCSKCVSLASDNTTSKFNCSWCQDACQSHVTCPAGSAPIECPPPVIISVSLLFIF